MSAQVVLITGGLTGIGRAAAVAVAAIVYLGLLPTQVLNLAAQSIVGSFLATFKDFPPRQKAASFTIYQAMAKMSEAASGAGH